MSEKVFNLVRQSVEEINQMLVHKIPIEQGAQCPLFNSEGSLDSMGLVSLIVEIEERLEKEFGVSIILANEKSMSKKKSPFLTVGTLSNYIDTLVREEGLNG